MRKIYRKLLKALVAILTIIGILTSGMVRTEQVNAASTNPYSNIVIDIAKKEVGYKETGNNNTKYAKFFDDLRKEKKYYYSQEKNGTAWCSIFVDWCFVQAYGYTFARQMRYKDANSFQGGASSTATYNQYKEKDLRGKFKPQPGDQIFFGKNGITHTGLVIGVTDKEVTTIEGNSSSEKNKVVKNTRKLTDSYIYGYGRPNYSFISPYYPFVNALYLNAVGDSCSVNALHKYVAKIGNDKIGTTFEPVMWEIYNLAKVKALSNDEFVNRLYKGLLGRSATANEKKHMLEEIKYASRRAALDEILGSKEWKDRAKSLGLKLS